MNHFQRVSTLLIVAGFAAFALAGCGKDSPQALTESSKGFIAKGDYKAATIQLRNALQQQPENGEARYLLGTVLIEGGDWASAEKELRKALEYNYSPDLVYPALLKAMLRQGEAKKAVAEFRDKHLADPAAEAALRSEVGMAYLGLGQSNEARASFAAALKAKPGYAKARIGEAIIAAQDQDIPGRHQDCRRGSGPVALDARGIVAEGRPAACAERRRRRDQLARAGHQGRADEHPGAFRPGVVADQGEQARPGASGHRGTEEGCAQGRARILSRRAARVSPG